MMNTPISDYIAKLTHKDLEQILTILELSKKFLVFDNCNEHRLYEDFLLNIWKTLKLKE